MKAKILVALFLYFNLLSAQPVISLQQIASGFTRPVDITNAGDERLFIVEQAGYIRIINAQGTINSHAFLNIDSRVGSNGNEQGLLGLVFHPNYKHNGYFYVNYTDNNGDTHISRFSVSASNPDSAVASSEMNLLTVAQPYSNHNAGDLNFGSDGYLYFGLGDGGSGGDPGNRAQNPQQLLGKMIRIDVDTVASYKIPPTNPFVNDPNTLDEIWAVGMRNPWRFSFDRLTGDMWIGDVGQNAREEVDFQLASSTGGENYGWNCHEGNNTYPGTDCGVARNYTSPVYDYANPSTGCSAIGGFVYRGCKYPNLFGYYVFCDYCSGRFWTIKNNGGTFTATSQGQHSPSYNFCSFGEDQNGELYVAGEADGKIYRITETTVATLPSIAANPGTSFCPGDSVTLSTQSGFASYDWALNDTSYAGSGLQITASTGGKYTLTVHGSNGCVYTTPGTAIASIAPPAPVVNAFFNSFCTGDSIQLTPGGNYNTYLWSNGFTSWTTFANQSGDYSVTVTDIYGCTGSSSPFSVTENPLPQPEIQQNGTLCNGSTASLSTTETFSTYSWTTGETTSTITVSQTGDYAVTATDANGCAGVSQLLNVLDNQLTKPIITSSKGTEFCLNDSSELTTTGGYDSYLWSTNENTAGITVTQAGSFWVNVSNANGCSAVSDTFKITTHPAPTPSIIPAGSIVQCGDGVVELYTDTAYSSYHWSRGDTISILFLNSSGTFNVTVSDANGCVGVTDSVEVSFYPNPLPSTISEGVTFNILVASDSGFNYQWYFASLAGQNPFILNGFTSQEIDLLQSPFGTGYFFVELTDSNGCKSSLSEGYYASLDGISETWLGNITLQPNPFTNEFVLNYNLKDLADLRIRLMDITGKEIASLLNERQIAGNHTFSINTSKLGLSPGIYFLEMANGSSGKTFKLVRM